MPSYAKIMTDALSEGCYDTSFNQEREDRIRAMNDAQLAGLRNILQFCLLTSAAAPVQRRGAGQGPARALRCRAEVRGRAAAWYFVYICCIHIYIYIPSFNICQIESIPKLYQIHIEVVSSFFNSSAHRLVEMKISIPNVYVYAK